MRPTLLIALFLCLEIGIDAFRAVPDVARLTKPGVNTSKSLALCMSQVDEEITQETIEIEIEEDPSSGTLFQPKNKKNLVLGLAVGSLATVAVAAKTNILPVPIDFEYTDALIARDLGATIGGGILAYAYVKICTTLAAKGILQPRDSRKIIHTFSAPLFMLIWPLFTPAGRYFAACVPLVNTLRLYLAGSGDLGESDLANAVSRSGDMKEALGGPFVYVLVILSSVLLFWRDSLIGITAMSTMAAGDGMADLIGRRFGKDNKWSFAPDKSVAGSAAFWLSATLCTCVLAFWLSFTGCLVLPVAMADLIPRVAAITAACALIELVPIANDNWTVPLGAALLTAIFLPTL